MAMHNITYNQNILFPAIFPTQTTVGHPAITSIHGFTGYTHPLQLVNQPAFYNHITSYQHPASNSTSPTETTDVSSPSSSCMFQSGFKADVKVAPLFQQTSKQDAIPSSDFHIISPVECNSTQSSPPLRHQLRLPTIKTSANVAENVMSEEYDVGYYSFTDLSPLTDIKDKLNCLDNVFEDDVKSTFSDIIDDVLENIDPASFNEIKCADEIECSVESECNIEVEKHTSVQQIQQSFSAQEETHLKPYVFQNISPVQQSNQPLSFSCMPSIPQFCYAANDFSANNGFQKSTQELVCNVCNKFFQNKTNLKVHQRMHKGERPHTCKYCSKTFTQKSTLRTHVRIHTGEKPFGCSFCTRAFSDYSTYRKHIRIHTGEKPYTCDLCKKSFTQSGNMIRHREVHYKKERRVTQL